MLSEKLKMILVAKGAPFSEEEMAAMDDAAGWGWIYAQRGPKRPKLAEVCFTGFSPAAKKALMALAEESGFRVAKTVTQGLAILCAGDNAGPKKLERATARGAAVMDEAAFRVLCLEAT